MNYKFQWTKMLSTPFVLGCATLGPIAYWSKAPGTIGSIAGIFLYTTFFHPLNLGGHADLFVFILLVALLSYFAVLICGEAEERMMKRDPGEVILDEFVAIPLCFFFMGDAFVQLKEWSWVLLLGGFGLFRFFDILKPLGIKKLQDLPGGFGVVADDLAAAAATCVCLHAGLYFILPRL